MRQLIAHLASSTSTSRLPIFHRSVLPILSLASSLYGFSVQLRRELYRWGILRRQRLPVPVLSVGNLTWGGNGKTPMTEFIARSYIEDGIVPLILTRGYGAGDEAAMLQRHFMNTPAKIGVGSNRGAVASSFLEKFGHNYDEPFQKKTSSENSIDLIIIDDGFQHWSLARDMDFVMVNAMNPWGNGNLIPRGTLRESIDALKRADVVIIHHADLVPETQLAAIKARLLNIKESLAVFYSRMAPKYLFDIRDIRTRIPLNFIENMTVLCVSSIGFPSAFSRGIKRIGAFHVDEMAFVDHHSIKLEDVVLIRCRLQELERRFGVRPRVVVTEKDFDRDPEILKEIKEFQVLVMCSLIEIIPSGEQAAENFKALLKHLHLNKQSQQKR